LVVEHGDGPEAGGVTGVGDPDGGTGVGGPAGVAVTVTVLAGVAAEVAEPHAAVSKPIVAREHTASIRRPLIADALMLEIPFIRYASLPMTLAGALRLASAARPGRKMACRAAGAWLE
jgi:hypothetical protein